MNQQTAVDGRIFVAYQWIPQLVDDINAGLVDHGVLADKLNWQTFILNNYPDVRFNWDEFQHEAFRIDDTAQIHVYVFPEPEDVGQPAFGAFFVRSTSNACAYYTLEMAPADQWTIVATQNGKRKSYGAFQPSFDDFLRWVIDRHNTI